MEWDDVDRSCTGQRHPTPFPVNVTARDNGRVEAAAASFPLERAVFQAPGQMGFCKETIALQAHYDRFALARRGVETANVRYVSS
jgi:hypothetical protein